MSTEIATIADALEAAGIPKSAIFDSGNALIINSNGDREVTFREDAGSIAVVFDWNNREVRLRFTKDKARQMGAFLLSWGYKK